MATEDSEFGGAGGLIQPLPHNPASSARETAFLERATDPFDEAVSPASVLADVLSGKYPRQPLPEAAELLPLQPDVAFVASSPDPGVGFNFVGVGNQDLRSARLKVSTSPGMYPATYGPEKEISPGVAPVVSLSVGVAAGHYYYQVLMNNLQVTDVWEVDVV